MTTISTAISSQKTLLAKNSNEAVIESLGDATIRAVVKSILEGGNLRDLTEPITRKRILENNIALLFLYFRMKQREDNLASTLTQQVSSELALRKSQSDREILLPLIGITKKGWDNIARGENGIRNYLETLDKNLMEIESAVVSEFGSIDAVLKIRGKSEQFSTRDILRCLLAIGSQTLAIRGSEKSIYGKLFERLVLGSVLSLLGFVKIDKDDNSRSEMVFWLSDPKNKRECDATAIVCPGVCIRFDIGFIGPGNSEISLDKASRYERTMERRTAAGIVTFYSHTIIIVDTLGARSKALAQAREIGGEIIQMNGSYWVKELAESIEKNANGRFKNKLARLSNDQSLSFIEQTIRTVELSRFLPPSSQDKNRTQLRSNQISVNRTFNLVADTDTIAGDHPFELMAMDGHESDDLDA